MPVQIKPLSKTPLKNRGGEVLVKQLTPLVYHGGYKDISGYTTNTASRAPTTEQSFTSSFIEDDKRNQNDEITYWKRKALENQKLFEEMNNLNQQLKEFHYRKTFEEQSSMNLTQNKLAQKNQELQEEISFLKNKLSKLEEENTRLSQKNNNTYKEELSLLRNKLAKLEEENAKLIMNQENIQKSHQRNDKNQQLEDEIRQLKRVHAEQIKNLTNQFEQTIEDQRIQNINQIKILEQRLIESQDNLEKEKQRYDHDTTVMNEVFENQLRNIKQSLNISKQSENPEKKSQFYSQIEELLSENQKLRERILQMQEGMRESTLQMDLDKQEMVELLQQAQRLCRDLENEKNDLQQYIDNMQRVSPGRNMDSEKIKLLKNSFEAMTVKCNKAEKMKEIELQLREDNYRQLISSLEISIQQQKESYEMQFLTLTAIIEAKKKENEELRQNNQVMAHCLNQQLAKYQSIVLDLELQRQTVPSVPNQISDLLAQNNELKNQISNLQHYLQVKSYECEQLKQPKRYG